ncbi:MAG TPA: class I SAM-dependent methyltransferase, partial [Myxococcota bacterium]|nr:class I SAM-dependent methyltransferase [Myxococcota bacterium]
LRQCGAAPPGPLLEVACGTARVALLLARRGWSMSGLDLRPEMLAFAEQRARAQGIALGTIRADMTRFDAGGDFAAAINPMSSFRLLDSDAAALAHLRCVAAALRPSGIYALDLTLARTADEPPITTSEAWEMSEGDVTVRATDDSILVNEAGRERTLAWGAEAHLRVLTGSAFLDLVEASGAFELLSWHPERTRDSGVSEFDPKRSSLPLVGRGIAALRRNG